MSHSPPPLVPLHTSHERSFEAQPLCLPGAQPPVGGDLDRREPQPRQDLQLRLHLLPGRSHQRERDARSSKPTACCRAGRNARRSPHPARSTRPRSFATRRRISADLTTSPSPATASPRPTETSTKSSPRCAEIKRRHGLDDVKMVLITNASMFHRPHVAARPGNPRREQRRNLGQARCRHRRVLPAYRSHDDSVPASTRQHHRRSPQGGRS